MRHPVEGTLQGRPLPEPTTLVATCNLSAALSSFFTVQSRRISPWVKVRFQDTGTGIAPEDLTKVFDSFFTTKAVGRGTGQGLAIARSVVVDKHHCAIDVESEFGVGAMFIVRLPRHDKTSEEEGARDSHRKGNRRNDPTAIC